MVKKAIEFEIYCDECGKLIREKYDEVHRRGKKEYCETCFKVTDKRLARKYPATTVIHWPGSKPLPACMKHARMAGGILGVLGAGPLHAELSFGEKACINCINEAIDKEEEEENDKLPADI